MEINRLSARAVELAVAPGRYCDGGGLALLIDKGGRKRYIMRFRFHGKHHEMGLGSANKGARTYVSLREARDRAEAKRLLLRDDISPLAAKRVEAPAVITFGAFAEELIEKLALGFRNAKHRQQWTNTIRQYCKPILDLPIDQIDTNHVLQVLEPIWTTKPETASRVRGRLERILNAAKTRGFRQGDNPAHWKGCLDQNLSKQEKLQRGHHRALPYDQVAQFLAALRRREGMSARCLEFLLLTATRSSEARGALWSEFDLDKAIWTIPASRMKAKREFRIPLTSRMLDILRRAKARASGPLVFPGPSNDAPLSDGAFKLLLRRMKVDCVPHGLRSTFRDWAAEQTDYPHEVVEAALAHVTNDASVAAYRRTDYLERRRELLEAWSTYCEPAKTLDSRARSS